MLYISETRVQSIYNSLEQSRYTFVGSYMMFPNMFIYFGETLISTFIYFQMFVTNP